MRIQRRDCGVDFTQSSAEVKERVEIYLECPAWAFVACYRVIFTFTLALYIEFGSVLLMQLERCSKSRRMRWAGHVARMGEERGTYRVFMEKPEGKRPLERPRRRWVDNIRMDLQEVGCGYMDWIGLAQDRDGWRTLVSAVMNLRVP